MSRSHSEKRRFYRHPIRVPIQLRLIEDEQVSSKTANISLGGLCFFWKDKLEKGKLLSVSIPVNETLFEGIQAKVTYSRQDKVVDLFKTGVSFLDAPSAFKAKLAEEALQILQYQKELSRTQGVKISDEEAADLWIERFAKYFPA